jgi:hypothetical protein
MLDFFARQSRQVKRLDILRADRRCVGELQGTMDRELPYDAAGDG